MHQVLPGGRPDDSVGHGSCRVTDARALGRRWREALADVAFVLPAAVLAFAIFFYPTVNALWHGFTDWQPGLPSHYVGTKNYHQLLGDDTFHRVLHNSLVYLLAVPILVFVPLVIAFLLYDRVPFAPFFRTLLLIPLVLAPPILGLLFASILNPTSGLLDVWLRRIGLDGAAKPWLDDPSLVKPTIVAIVLWGTLGVSVLIFHAALSAIPPDLFEVADLDGASSWRKIRDVVIPGIRPVLEAVIALTVVSVFTAMFGLIQVLTGGGPNRASSTIDFDIYNRALLLQNYGGASAEAGLLLVGVAALVGLLVLLRRVLARPRTRVLTSRRRRTRTRRTISRPSWSTRAPKTWSYRRWSRRSRWSIPRIVGISLLSVLFVYPFIYLVGTAVKPETEFNQDPIGLPHSFTSYFLKTAWEAVGLGHAMVNSLIAVGIGVTVCTVLSSLASFWFIRHRGPVRIALFAGMSVFYFVPAIVWVIPLETVLVRLGFGNSIFMLGLVYGVSQLPFGIALLTVYLSRGISDSMLEAARVDGASLWKQYWHLVLPLSRPAIAALAPLVTAFLWGDLIIGLVLIQDPAKYPVTLAATQLVGRITPSLQASAAAGVISFFPLLILFALSQRWMVRGITVGVGKE